MNPLAPHYSRFRVAERILLTGHSHQAWPDEAFDAQQRAWLDAAEYVADKWARAEERAAEVRAGFARLLGDAAENVALGQNTHELVTRWLSALPLRDRPRIVTTDAEFHSLRRQLDRLGEEPPLAIVRVPAHPADTGLPVGNPSSSAAARQRLPTISAEGYARGKIDLGNASRSMTSSAHARAPTLKSPVAAASLSSVQSSSVSRNRT